MANTESNALDIAIIENPHHQTVLKSKASKVNFPLSKEEKKLIKAMTKRLHELGGVGLAAPQVNVGKQIIALYIPREASLLRDNVTPYPMHVMINPSYEAYGDDTLEDFEACYSVRDKAGKVTRFASITLKYDDEKGNHHRTVESGFYARVLQHEIDHLNGLLITDRLTPDSIQGSVEEIMALRRAELSEEKRKHFDEVMRKKHP